MRMQAFDKGPWPRMTGRQRGILMNKLADLMQVSKHHIIATTQSSPLKPCT